MMKKITLGGQEFNLLPCPAIGLKEIGRNFGLIGTGNDAGLDALVAGIYYGVKRGLGKDDKTFAREFVEWNIDPTNLEDLAQAFADVNNAVKAEGSPQGEAQAAS